MDYNALEQFIRVQMEAGCSSTGDEKSLNQGN